MVKGILAMRPELPVTTLKRSVESIAIPQALSHLVALNVEYGVLFYIANWCWHALKLTDIPRHLDIKHKTAIELQKQVG